MERSNRSYNEYNQYNTIDLFIRDINQAIEDGQEALDYINKLHNTLDKDNEEYPVTLEPNTTNELNF